MPNNNNLFTRTRFSEFSRVRNSRKDHLLKFFVYRDAGETGGEIPFHEIVNIV